MARVARLTEHAVTVEFAVPPDLQDAYDHAAGQHIVVLHAHGDEVIRRTYSICTPASSGVLRIAVKELEGGAFSSHANRQLREDDVLHVMVPSGSFGAAFDSAVAKSYGLVAAGSGITPILSIAATALEREPQSRVSLLYGNRTLSTVMFRAELDALRALHRDRFSVMHVLSREKLAEHSHGRIRPELLNVAFRIDEIDEWFLCGPEPLLEQVTTALLEQGVQEERIHRELFHAGGEPLTDPDSRPALASDVRLRLNGEETLLSLHSLGEPILTEALTQRDDLPYACQEAVCGTCRAKVVEGEVVMDRCSALDRRELESGYVLTCQAHPVTPNVTLDFDA